MKIFNPTDQKVKITVDGITKEVEPKSEVSVEDSFGDKWLVIHQFLQDASEVVKVAKKEVAEVIEEAKDVVEAVEDAIDKVTEEVKKAKKK